MHTCVAYVIHVSYTVTVIIPPSPHRVGAISVDGCLSVRLFLRKSRWKGAGS